MVHVYNIAIIQNPYPWKAEGVTRPNRGVARRGEARVQKGLASGLPLYLRHSASISISISPILATGATPTGRYHVSREPTDDLIYLGSKPT